MGRLAWLIATNLALAGCSFAPGPEEARAAHERGLAALKVGDPRRARVELLNAIKADPNRPEYRLSQARAYLALRRGAAAEAEIVRARQLGARAADTHHLLAHAYSLQGRHRAALTEAKRAPPTQLTYLARVRARSLSATGKQREARALFAQALTQTPGDSGLWTDVARFHRRSGDRSAARRAADRAVALDARNVEALLLRGRLAERDQGRRAALAWYDRAVTAAPDDTAPRLRRAETLEDIGEHRAMLADTRAVLAADPGNRDASFYQARLAARGGKHLLGKRLLQRTGTRFGRQPRALFLAGAIEHHLGNHESAIDSLEQLLARRRGHRGGRRLLAASYLAVGEAEKAARLSGASPKGAAATPDRNGAAIRGREPATGRSAATTS